MKKDIHPKYQEVLWTDTATGLKWVCGSALSTEGRETYEGKEYPLVKVPVSSASHPFFTGSKQFVDAEGRVDKFRKRYAKAAPQEIKEEEKEEEKPVQVAKVAKEKVVKEKAPAKKAAPKKKAEQA